MGQNKLGDKTNQRIIFNYLDKECGGENDIKIMKMTIGL
jgi:hypothetical protein